MASGWVKLTRPRFQTGHLWRKGQKKKNKVKPYTGILNCWPFSRCASGGRRAARASCARADPAGSQCPCGWASIRRPTGTSPSIWWTSWRWTPKSRWGRTHGHKMMLKRIEGVCLQIPVMLDYFDGRTNWWINSSWMIKLIDKCNKWILIV